MSTESTETAGTAETPQPNPLQKELEKALRAELVKQQDLLYAIVGGLASAIVSGILWAVITVSTEYQIGYMAVGVGLIVGFAVRYFGAGIDQHFGFIGAIFALFGCALGNLLSQLGFIAHQESIGYFETLSYLNFDVILELYKASFSPMDVLFYGIAAYEGYRFAFRKIEEELVVAVTVGKVNPPPLASMRLPIVIGLVVLISGAAFAVSSGSSAVRTFKYESGAKSGTGEMVAGRENGAWEMWWENGSQQAQGSFNNGNPDGAWTYYNEEGVVTRKGSYKDGVKDGEWTDFNADGSVSARGSYQYGRLNGPWVYNYENGNPSSKGSYVVDLQDGEWETYYEDGQLSSKGSYTAGTQTGAWTQWYADGKKREEVEFDAGGEPKWLNTWLEDGKAVIVNGNGDLKLLDYEGNIAEAGKVKGGFRDGAWKKFFGDGKKREDGEYRDNVYYVLNAWSAAGEVYVSNGTGPMESFYADGSKSEFGNVRDGLREEKWTVNFPGTDQVMMESDYKRGKLNGVQTGYASEGYVEVQGSYVDDVREGEWKWYSSDGVVESVVTFVGGKKVGGQLFYNVYGDLLKTEVYDNGKLVETKL